MEIKINIPEALELAAAIDRLAYSISTTANLGGIPADFPGAKEFTETTEKAWNEEPEKPKKEAATKREDPKPEPSEEPKKEEPGISLDVVTSKVRAFIQASAENKGRLKTFLDEKGAKKVTDLDPAHYPNLLELVG